MEGTRDIINKVVENVYGEFLPEVTSVLLYNDSPAGFAFANVTAGNLVRKVSGKFLIQIRAVRQKCVQIAGFVRPRKQSIPLFLKSSRFLRGFLPESVGASLLFANNPGGFPDCFLSSR